MTDTESRLRAYARAEWPGIDWARAEFRVGAFHTVAVPPAGPVLRLTTGNHFSSRAHREARTLHVMARIALPVPIPRLLAGPLEADEWSATLITTVPGEQTDDVTLAAAGRVQGCVDLLRALQAVDPSTVADLPTRRAWCGGEEWPAVVRDALAPLLDVDARRAASDRVAELLDVEDTGAAVVCHGDFGPHNILWSEDQPASLIDLDHALNNFASRYAQGTLFDPTGMKPTDL